MITGPNSGGSPKILVAFGSAIIRGYTKKGKQFFGLELNNLTEPIKSFKMRWPNQIYITGHYIYNNYTINSDGDSKSSSVVQSKNYYVCPEKINELILIEDKHNRKLGKHLFFSKTFISSVIKNSIKIKFQISRVKEIFTKLEKVLLQTFQFMLSLQTKPAFFKLFSLKQYLGSLRGTKV